MNLLEMTGETGQYLQDYRDLSVVDNPIDYQHVHQVFETKRGKLSPSSIPQSTTEKRKTFMIAEIKSYQIIIALLKARGIRHCVLSARL